MTPRIALATCAELPDLWHDDHLLRDALGDRGAAVAPVVWDDPAADWAAYDLVVVRSTWDYFLGRRDDFTAWADRVEAVVPLHNPAPVLRWNSEKTYLRDLAARGVPVVPTAWIEPGATGVDLAALLAERDWNEAVVKPAVSGGAWETARVTAEAPGSGQELLDRIVARDWAMVQPYLASVETEGERGLVFLDGTPSHAVRRAPSLVEGSGGPTAAAPVAATAEEVRFAEAVLEAVGRTLLYARVDLVRDDAGGLRLIELEAIEPQLFLRHAPGAANRLAGAILDRLG